MQKMHYTLETTLCYISPNLTLFMEHLAEKTKMSTFFAFDLTVTWHDLFKKHFKNVMSSSFWELSIAAFGGALRPLVRKLTRAP